MKPPAFLFYADDFLAGTINFSDAELGLYIRLLCVQWSTGSIPNDDTEIECYQKGEPKATLSRVKSKFKLCPDGFLRNERMEIERTKQTAYRDAQSAYGKHGGRPSKGFEKGSERVAFPEKKGSETIPSPSPSPSPLINSSISISLGTPSVNETNTSSQINDSDPEKEMPVNANHEEINSQGVANNDATCRLHVGYIEPAGRLQSFEKVASVLCAMFDRKPGEPLSYLEESSIQVMLKRPGLAGEIEEIKAMNRDKYFPQSLKSLVTEWGTTLDRSRKGTGNRKAKQKPGEF
jgi:uncharacterized protein YdaU (DUF1376 family)